MKKLSGLDEKAILASYIGGGESVTELAKRFGVSRQWVSTLVNRFKRDRAGIEDIDAVNFKSRLKRKSIVALEAGLDGYAEDPWKSGALGLRSLEAMGSLADGLGGDFAETLANVPEEYAAMFGLVVTPDTASKEGEAVAALTHGKNTVTDGQTEVRPAGREFVVTPELPERSS